jgi:hypothetical protein
MLSLSKHGGQGLCARPFDELRVTVPLHLIDPRLTKFLKLRKSFLVLPFTLQSAPNFQTYNNHFLTCHGSE